MTRVKRCQVGLVGMPAPSTWLEHDTQIHTVISGSAGSLSSERIFDSKLPTEGEQRPKELLERRWRLLIYLNKQAILNK